MTDAATLESYLRAIQQNVYEFRSHYDRYPRILLLGSKTTDLLAMLHDVGISSVSVFSEHPQPNPEIWGYTWQQKHPLQAQSTSGMPYDILILDMHMFGSQICTCNAALVAWNVHRRNLITTPKLTIPKEAEMTLKLYFVDGIESQDDFNYLLSQGALDYTKVALDASARTTVMAERYDTDEKVRSWMSSIYLQLSDKSLLERTGIFYGACEWALSLNNYESIVTSRGSESTLSNGGRWKKILCWGHHRTFLEIQPGEEMIGIRTKLGSVKNGREKILSFQKINAGDAVPAAKTSSHSQPELLKMHDALMNKLLLT